MPRIYTPFASYEELSLAANTFTQSDQAKFKPPGSLALEVESILFDGNSTSALVRFGRRGGAYNAGDLAPMVAFNNTPIMNATTDAQWPLWVLRHPYTLGARQSLGVELEDTSAGSRSVTVMAIGHGKKSGRPVVLTDQVTVAASSDLTAQIKGLRDEDVVITAIQLYLGETGSAALNRQILMKVVPPSGEAPWSLFRVPASLCMPHSNAASSVWTPPEKLILEPGEALDFDLLHTGAATVRIGMIGYQLGGTE